MTKTLRATKKQGFMKNGTKFGNATRKDSHTDHGDFVMKAREEAEIQAGMSSSGINRTGGIGRLIGLGQDQARDYGPMIHDIREKVHSNYAGRISNGMAGKTAEGVNMGVEGGISVEHTRRNNPVTAQTKFASGTPSRNISAVTQTGSRSFARKASFAPA